MNCQRQHVFSPAPPQGQVSWAAGEMMGHRPGHVFWGGEVAPMNPNLPSIEDPKILTKSSSSFETSKEEQC